MVSWEWSARLRHENVEDAAFVRDADATTLRLGLRLRLDHGFSALLEGEGIANAGDGYNSGANRHTAHPLVGDAEDAELNQVWVAWRNVRFGATVGRQRIVFDNQRWIGNVGWRQNEQTFDAVALEWRVTPELVARYAWLDRVHRVAGDKAVDPLARERALDTHLLHLAWQRGPQQLIGYAWLHEDQDVPAASTATFGLRSVTNRVREGRGWGLTLELAEQREHADNPLSFSRRYWLAEPSLTLRGTTFRAGWEHLGGNGRHALQTPLATLHAFNGWADLFTVTPPGGLEDCYLAAGRRFGEGGRYEWQLAWHDYAADAGPGGGQEWNASFAFPVVKGVRGLIKFADYRADGLGRDVTKTWLQLEWSH